MIKLILAAAVTAVFILVAIIMRKEKKFSYVLAAMIISVLFLVDAVHVLNENFFSYEAKKQEWKFAREPLVYQVIERDIDGALAVAISEFNCKLATEKEKNKSAWDGWYVGDYIEQINYIQMPSTQITNK